MQLALDAFEQALGTRPLLTRVGGSIPLMPALTEKGIDTILSGFALPESNVHSPNERFLVEYFAAGIDTVAALFTALGRTKLASAVRVGAPAGQPLVAELAHGVDDRQERFALCRQRVLDARRRFGIATAARECLRASRARSRSASVRGLMPLARALELREAARTLRRGRGRAAPSTSHRVSAPSPRPRR